MKTVLLLLLLHASAFGLTSRERVEKIRDALSVSGEERKKILSQLPKEEIFRFLLGFEDFPYSEAEREKKSLRLYQLSKGDPYIFKVEGGKYGDQENKAIMSLLSKESTFQWAELVRTTEEPPDLGRIVGFTAKKYEEYEKLYTDQEKTHLVGLMILGVEKDIKNRGYGFGALQNLSRVDHPLVDDLIEKLKPIMATDENCRYFLNSLIVGLAATRAEKAARLKATADQTPVPTAPAPQVSWPPPAASPTRPPAPVQSLPAAAPASRLQPWLLAGGAVIAAAAVALIRAALRRQK